MAKLNLKPLIGLVSGTGPLAGSNTFEKILKYAAQNYNVSEDHEYPDVLLVNHGTKGVDNLGTINKAFEKDTIKAIKYLENQGCTVIGVACNTAHIHFNGTKVGSKKKLVNLIDIVSKEASNYPGEYLLVTSNASKIEKLYHSYLKRYGVSFEETTKEEQLLIDRVIGLVMAYKLDQAAEVLKGIFVSAKKRGLRGVITGCTELPIAIDHCKDTQNLNIIDCNYILAKSLVDKYFTDKD